MNPRHYRTPVWPVSTRLRCPVCNEAVYSTAGIHPQCAVRLSDPPKPKAKPPGAAQRVVPDPEVIDPAVANKAADDPSATASPSVPA